MSNFTVQQFAVGSQDEVLFYLHVVVTVVSVLPYETEGDRDDFCAGLRRRHQGQRS
jgi:hypothetical protein